MPPYHHGDLRRALLESAADLLAEPGTQSLSLREVARRSGVSHAAPYRHFADKIALEAGVAESGFSSLRAALVAASDSESGGDLASLEAVAVAYVGFAARNRPSFRAMFGTAFSERSKHPPLREASDAMFAVFLEVVSRCQMSGAMRPGSTRVHALALWSILHGLAVLIVCGQLGSNDPPDATERRARQMVRTVLEGLR
ncbi:MAG: TetR/AcrR family transcriptional regulator [Gemmatimonadaceae bacterium]